MKRIAFKVLGVAVALVFLAVWWQERSSLSRLKKYGLTAYVEPITSYTKHRSHGITDYSAEFRFTTSDGHPIKRRTTFPKELLADFEAGKPVKIYYEAGSPGEFVFEKDSPSWILPAAGAVILVGALVVL